MASSILLSDGESNSSINDSLCSFNGEVNTTNNEVLLTNQQEENQNLDMIEIPEEKVGLPFLDDNCHIFSRSSIERRIPKPHFLDLTPSPDELDEHKDVIHHEALMEGLESRHVQKCTGAIPKKTQKNYPTSNVMQNDGPKRTNFMSIYYGLENKVKLSKQDKRTSQLYRDKWSGEYNSSNVHRNISYAHDSAKAYLNFDNQALCIHSLLSLYAFSPENNIFPIDHFLELSNSTEYCIAMRQAGCLVPLVQIINMKIPKETRMKAVKLLDNIIHSQKDDKTGRREARVLRLLDQVREFCYYLEDLSISKTDGDNTPVDDPNKHPSQSVTDLMKLSFDEEHRHIVCQLGGLQTLAELVSIDQKVHGSQNENSTCLTMRKYAGMTLTNLTFGDGKNKSLLCSFKDFMTALVEQLESPNDDMRQVIAAVLRNLSWRADTRSKQALREVNAVQGLIKAAMTCHKETTLKSVLSALWNLTAHCSANKVALCSVDGALDFLIDMLTYESSTKTLAIVENAGGILRNVSNHIAVKQDFRQILREKNCLRVLLQHLKSPSLTVVSNSCGTLWNLSARCAQDQQYLLEHGAVPMLRSLIHSKHKMISTGSTAALKNLLNSVPGKVYVNVDSLTKNSCLRTLPSLEARKQKALKQELDQNLSETCDNIEPVTSPTTSNREEKNLYTATEKQIAMNLDRHKHSTRLQLIGSSASNTAMNFLSLSNDLSKGLIVRSSNNVNNLDGKHLLSTPGSDSILEKSTSIKKVPVPTPRNKEMKTELKEITQSPPKLEYTQSIDCPFIRYPILAPVPSPRNIIELRTSCTESVYDDQELTDQPIDFSRKYFGRKSNESMVHDSNIKEEFVHCGPSKKSDNRSRYGDYQETDLDQPTDYSLRYAEQQSETNSDLSEPTRPSVHEDSLKYFCTEGTPYETPIIFSTATSMSDLRLICNKDQEFKCHTKESSKIATHSDEKDTCSIEEPPNHEDLSNTCSVHPSSENISGQRQNNFDTKYSSGLMSPEKPINYCDEGTPGYFSRVSSLSSLGEVNEDNLAKKHALPTINMDKHFQENDIYLKDREVSKAVTFAAEPVATLSENQKLEVKTTKPPSPPLFVEDTPLMFSRSSSLGSLPECEHQDDEGSIASEISRITSGCISPSEIPDSPGVRISPILQHEVPPVPILEPAMKSVFEERVETFNVESTPALLSTATSLSSLTFEELKLEDKGCNQISSQRFHDDGPVPITVTKINNRSIGNSISFSNSHTKSVQGCSVTGDYCQVYFTEDTPADLSKTGSNSNLSALSMDCYCKGLSCLDFNNTPNCTYSKTIESSSDSSNSSDTDKNVLEESIQKGIAKVVSAKSQTSDFAIGALLQQHFSANQIYRSLPTNLGSSPETSLSHNTESSTTVSHSCRAKDRCVTPPIPQSSQVGECPDSPTLSLCSDDERVLNKAITQGLSSLNKDAKHASKERMNIMRADSLSSLSLDSFGSTDREIFEDCIRIGLSRVQTKTLLENNKDEGNDKTPHKSNKFEVRKKSEVSSQYLDIQDAHSPYSMHGSCTSALSHNSQPTIRHSGSRLCNEMPLNLPAKIDESKPRTQIKHNLKWKLDGQSKPLPGALDKMIGEKSLKVLEEVIARGASPNTQSKNLQSLSVTCANADGSEQFAQEIMCLRNGCNSVQDTSVLNDLLSSININTSEEKPFLEPYFSEVNCDDINNIVDDQNRCSNTKHNVYEPFINSPDLISIEKNYRAVNSKENELCLTSNSFDEIVSNNDNSVIGLTLLDTSIVINFENSFDDDMMWNSSTNKNANKLLTPINSVLAVSPLKNTNSVSKRPNSQLLRITKDNIESFRIEKKKLCQQLAATTTEISNNICTQKINKNINTKRKIQTVKSRKEQSLINAKSQNKPAECSVKSSQTLKKPTEDIKPTQSNIKIPNTKFQQNTKTPQSIITFNHNSLKTANAVKKIQLALQSKPKINTKEKLCIQKNKQKVCENHVGFRFKETKTSSIVSSTTIDNPNQELTKTKKM